MISDQSLLLSTNVLNDKINDHRLIASYVRTFILYILEKFEVTIISSCMLTVNYEL